MIHGPREPLTPGREWSPAERPTMYFIGVTTEHSSIMQIFPRWAEHLGLEGAVLRGMNFRLHDDPAQFRRAVEFIRDDPLSLGALVTSHKIDLLHASRDLFDELDELARQLDEVSSLSKRGGLLVGHAKDPITSGLALESILGPSYWKRTGAEALVCGAGGSTVALTWYMLRKGHGPNRPARLVVTNRSPDRLAALQERHRRMGADIPVEYHLTATAEQTDRLLAGLRPGSLIVNATGLGKDAPGAPISPAAPWPEASIAWDFNYRGQLLFLEYARAQRSRNVRAVDGWEYFIHGWTRVIAEVFSLEIPSSGRRFNDLSRIAAAFR